MLIEKSKKFLFLESPNWVIEYGVIAKHRLTAIFQKNIYVHIGMYVTVYLICQHQYTPLFLASLFLFARGTFVLLPFYLPAAPCICCCLPFPFAGGAVFLLYLCLFFLHDCLVNRRRRRIFFSVLYILPFVFAGGAVFLSPAWLPQAQSSYSFLVLLLTLRIR